MASLEAFGCEGSPLAIGAAAAVLAYVEGTNRDLLRLLRGLQTYSTLACVALDSHTRRNLELTRAARSGERTGSLLAVIDGTRTAMGGRLLRRWLSRPLQDVAALNARLDAVEALAGNHDLRADLIVAIERAGDLERLAGRARQGIATPRDLLNLAAGLRCAGEVRRVATTDRGEEPVPPCADASTDLLPAVGLIAQGVDHVTPHADDALADLMERIDPASDVADLIEGGVSGEDGRMVRDGFDAVLDELTSAVRNARRTLLEMEQEERTRTGIRSLKIGFNKVFGYYIEVSKANLRYVPAHYARRQTLANAERFVTPELKEWEARILRAEEQIGERERAVFTGIVEAAGAQIDRLLSTAAALAELDVYASFADLAVRRRYVRPTLDDSTVIDIDACRHPVVERALEAGAIVPNDVKVGDDPAPLPHPRNGEGENGSGRGSISMESSLRVRIVPPALTEREAHPPLRFGEGGRGVGSSLLLLTGPNMAGKSTYLRQTALVVLMAQIGCFVPAERARIGLVDRIYTRVGAQDDLASGASTFMVEMVETAAILRHATARSLLIFDEIGRGTSTYDGLSIAQAVVEDVHDRIGARTLFATHFHELTALADRLPGVRNFNVAAREEDGKVVFLRKVVPGGADRSYGIHVARLAGLPEHVTLRAEELLAALEADRAPERSAGGEDALLEPIRLPDRQAAPDRAVAETSHSYDTSRSGGCPVCAPVQAGALLAEVRTLNLAATTPIQALNILFSLQQRLMPAGRCVCGGESTRRPLPPAGAGDTRPARTPWRLPVSRDAARRERRAEPRGPFLPRPDTRPRPPGLDA